MMRWLLPLATGLVAAIIGFCLVINAVPGFLMSKAMDRISAASDVSENAVWHGPITDETTRRVVRPSPDILYSVCLFDLSDGPLELTVPWPSDDSYASVSFYDANTNNFAVVNDRDVDGAEASHLLLAEDGESGSIQSPTQTGLALYRRVVMGGTSVEQADTERRGFDCRGLWPS
jgi:uncharacterized membrane protein